MKSLSQLLRNKNGTYPIPCKVGICESKEVVSPGILLCPAHYRRILKNGHLSPRKPIKKRTFGETIIRKPEYRAWVNLRERCRNPRHINYKNYGGRGIKVCKRWDDFQNFFDDMGPRPGRGFSIDRINNNRGYSPSNCRWATPKQQANNKRNSRVLKCK